MRTAHKLIYRVYIMKDTTIFKNLRAAFKSGVDSDITNSVFSWDWEYELQAFRAGENIRTFSDVESCFREWLKAYFKMDVALWERHCEQAAEMDKDENLARLTKIKDGSSEFKTKCFRAYTDGLNAWVGRKSKYHDSSTVLGRILHQAYDAADIYAIGFDEWWNGIMNTSESARKFHVLDPRLPETSVDIAEVLKDATDDQQFKFVYFVYKDAKYFVSESRQGEVVNHLASKSLNCMSDPEVKLLIDCHYALSDTGKVLKCRYESDIPKNFYPAIIAAKEWNHAGA